MFWKRHVCWAASVQCDYQPRNVPGEAALRGRVLAEPGLSAWPVLRGGELQHDEQGRVCRTQGRGRDVLPESAVRGGCLLLLDERVRGAKSGRAGLLDHQWMRRGHHLHQRRLQEGLHRHNALIRVAERGRCFASGRSPVAGAASPCGRGAPSRTAPGQRFLPTSVLRSTSPVRARWNLRNRSPYAR